MYEGFFGLQARPFPAAPLVANYFPSHSIEAARQNLLRAISRTEGPGVIVGPSGVGKTLLLRVLAEHFHSSLRVVVLAGTRVNSRKSLLQNILFELDLPYRGMDEGELRLALLDVLRRSDAIPHGILLLIDEAHLMPLRLIDEARLITNVVHDGQPRVRLVLAGGPQLEERLTHPQLDSFNQRIAARCYLQPFNRDETEEYVRAELSWAGGDADAIFSGDALQAVYRASDGVPRIINQVCDHALVMAHHAERRSVDAGLIQEAWADLQQLPPPWQASSPTANVAATAEAIVEFGHLEEPAVETSEVGSPTSFEANSCVAHNDSPCDLSDRSETPRVDTLLVDEPVVAEEPGWSSCGETLITEPAARPLETNPFSDSFDEELVVIDRNTALSADGFRGRPRVSCVEGREIVDALAQMQMPTVPGSPEASRLGCLVSDSVAMPGFEYSTLQDLPAIDAHDELISSPATAAPPPKEQVELSFEDEADCVPLPWTRGTLEDDRDIIVIEDDTVFDLSAGGEQGTVEPSGRKPEYRELFAQLRKASN